MKEKDKLDQAVVLYMKASLLGSNVGAHCGDCWKFVGGESEGPGSCIEVGGDISGPRGICGLYVNGRVFENGKKPDFSLPNKLSKEQAGYIEDGPTHCVSCEYFVQEGECNRVKSAPDPIEALGCCNEWDDIKAAMRNKLVQIEKEIKCRTA